MVDETIRAMSPLPSAISHQPSAMNWFTGFLRRPPIGWWDLADIVVVSILIYEVLKLIRGTRAVQMALGGGVFVALFYGSRWGHLETVNWLIRNMCGYIRFGGIAASRRHRADRRKRFRRHRRVRGNRQDLDRRRRPDRSGARHRHAPDAAAIAHPPAA